MPNKKLIYTLFISAIIIGGCKSGSNPELNKMRDHTTYLQNLIDRAYKSKDRTVKITKGTYYISSLEVGPGITLQGEKGVRFVKLPNSKKFSRMINTYNNQYSYSSDSDSAPLRIENIHFDGNRVNQGKYRKYELEQQHMIFLSADRKKRGRLVAEIKNCFFEEGVADGIHVYTNVDVTIKNCKAMNVFRGGITAGGGNSKMHIEEFYAGGDVHKTGINFEVDGQSKFTKKDIDVHMKNVELEGNFDLAIYGNFTGDSLIVHSYPFKLYAPSGKVRIKNSCFYGLNARNSSINFPHDVEFKTCTFIQDDFETNSPTLLTIYNETSYKKSENNLLRFINCKFQTQSGAIDQTAIRIMPDKLIGNNQTQLINCNIDKKFKNGIQLNSGGNLKVEESSISCKNAISAKSGKGRFYKVTLEKNIIPGNVNYINNAQNIITADKSYNFKELNKSKSATKILLN